MRRVTVGGLLRCKALKKDENTRTLDVIGFEKHYDAPVNFYYNSIDLITDQ